MQYLLKHPRMLKLPRPAADLGRRRQWLRAHLIDLLLDARDAVLAGVLGMFLMSMAPMAFGWKTTVVVSGSMVPSINPGDVVAASPASGGVAADRALPGQVVLVDDPVHPGEYLMHRLVKYDAAGRMILKGDANAVADSTPVAAANLRGIPRLRMPLIGMPYLWLQQRRLFPAGCAATILLVMLLWRPRRRAGPAGWFGATVTQLSCTARRLTSARRATESGGLKPRGGFLDESDEGNRHGGKPRRGIPDPE